MKLDTRKAGTSTAFVDVGSGEVLLHFLWDSAGIGHVAYHIYDCRGQLIADSGGLCALEPLRVVGPDDEVLLELPTKLDEHVHYRLYNQDGKLLTASDGSHTSIFPFLRMESPKSSG